MKKFTLLFLITSTIILVFNTQITGSCSCEVWEYEGDPENFDYDKTCKHCSTCTQVNGNKTCKCPSESECAVSWILFIVAGCFICSVIAGCICGRKKRESASRTNSYEATAHNNNQPPDHPPTNVPIVLVPHDLNQPHIQQVPVNTVQQQPFVQVARVVQVNHPDGQQLSFLIPEGQAQGDAPPAYNAVVPSDKRTEPPTTRHDGRESMDEDSL